MTSGDLDRIWDFNKPADSESWFRELLSDAGDDVEFRAEVLTQIARARGLQGDFAGGHRSLDEADAMLMSDPKSVQRPRVRSLLERGRLHNSAGSPQQAKALFLAAWELATASEEEYLAVDAAHMLGIVGLPSERLEWSRRALDLAQQSTDPKTGRWVAPIANNLGWTLFEVKDYPAALELFEQARQVRQESGQPEQIRIARWAVAKTLRHLERVEEAFEIHATLKTELDDAGESDPYVDEELGECLLLIGRPDDARVSFARALDGLSRDPWFVKHEPARLARLGDLAGPRLERERALDP